VIFASLYVLLRLHVDLVRIGSHSAAEVELEFRTWELFAHQEMADRSIARVLVGAIGGGASVA
jgi:hypothetical protein